MNDSEAGPSTRVTENFDVFLNHRGPDTKATFVAHLDEALRCARFRPFLDRLSLREGNPNQESIYQALDMAKVHVAVVSKGYAESQYCLDELVAMKRSHKPVIPVFYGVEPNDLRWVKKRKFAEAFEKHEARQTPEKLREWTSALGWLAGISGFCFDTTCKDRDEAKLKQDVVNAVARNFPRGSSSVDENRRVGLEESKKEVVRKLESRRVGVVGVYGMGGIGKTTLAEAVYEHFAPHFGHRSFLRDVRSSYPPLTLPNQLIKDLRVGKEVSSRESYREEFLEFQDLKVLIVVDDIDDERQFQEIIPDLGQFGKGSKIIVTSRHQRVLSNVLMSTAQPDMAERERSVLHEVEVLKMMESRQLFNFHAFPSKSPDRGFEDLAVKVADACGGHPLALEIAGCFLRNKKNLESDRVLWDEISKKATRNEKLGSILKISYEKGLDNCQRTMFLDISCLLIGKPKAVALEIWASCESCGCEIDSGVESSLRDLMEKCLVKLDTDGCLRMHDVLRDMGRQIVDVKRGSELGKRTHFWDPNLAAAVLKGRKGSNKVRGFSITRPDGARDTSFPTYDAGAFSQMSELHLLVLDGCRVSGDFSKWSRELRLLQWRQSRLSELPSELNLEKIAVVDLSCSYRLKLLWKEDRPLRMAWSNMRRLNLDWCSSLTTLPQDIGNRLSELKVLELTNCGSLESLPDSIGDMKDLERLILQMCVKLRSIPDTVGRLKKLKHVDLSLCVKLEILPDALVNLGTLTALETLDFSHNHFITELPESFTGLISLVHLNMNCCFDLRTVKALPRNLQHLDLGSCWKLDHLPSFEGLTSLAILTLSACGRLKEIQGLDCLTTLEEVNLAGCTSMQPLTLQLQHKPAMRSCCLSGSNVAVKYDREWSESEPAVQLITYYDDKFGFLEDGLVRRVSAVEDCDEVCIEATIESEDECVAVVICCVAHEQWEDEVANDGSYTGPCFLDVGIVRKGQEVFRSQELIMLKKCDCRDQVYLCTLRRTHPLVRDLKIGDKIQVVARSKYRREAITVKRGAICVVDAHGDDQVLSVNSKLLDVQQSREKRVEFAELILKDNPECPEFSESAHESDGSDSAHDSDDSEIGNVCARRFHSENSFARLL